MKRVVFALAVLYTCFGLVSPAGAQPQEEHQPYEPPECIADWDPFCPQGTPGGGDSDYPQWCFKCELTTTGEKCVQTAEGETGREDCTTVWEGADPISCSTSGTFCENITITP